MKKRPRHCFAAVDYTGWILLWTIAGTAKQVRYEVGRVYSTGDEIDAVAGWQNAKNEHGITVKKIKLSIV